MFCRQVVAQLRREQYIFERSGIRVVLVAMGSPKEASAFAEKFHLPFTVIADPGRELYRNFALRQVSIFSLLSPSVILKGARALIRGHIPGRPIGDIRQLPGLFLITTEGRILCTFGGNDPSAHPAADRIIEALAAAAS